MEKLTAPVEFRAASLLTESLRIPETSRLCFKVSAGRGPAGMSKALSLALRQRTLAAVLEEGLSHCEATARFKVSAASINRWRALSADGAVPMHGALSGDRRSHVI